MKLTMIVIVFLVLAMCGSCATKAPKPTVAATITPGSQTPAVPETPPDDVCIPWLQRIGTTRYRWDCKDLYAKHLPAKKVGLFALAAERYKSSFEGEGGSCSVSTYFTPVAVVGDLVGYEFESGVYCGTVQGEWWYTTVDVAKPTKPLDLRTFFTDDQILRAFLADPQLSSDIQRSVAEHKLPAVPTTLRDLSRFLTKFDYQIYNGESYFEADYLTRFVFHHLDGDTIYIRVSATSTSTAGRAIHQYAEIGLPIPDRLRDALRKANAREEGFLMNNSVTKLGTKPATFEARF